MRAILVPSGKWIPLRAYIAAWRLLKRADPDKEIRGWQWYPVTARDVLRDLRNGMHDRISQAIPYTKRGWS